MIENQNLSEIDGIQLVLRDLKNKSFPRISVTEKCLTIGSKIVNLADNNSWSFNFKVPKSQEEKKFTNDWIWDVKYAANIDSTSRQILRVTRESAELNSIYDAFVVKP